MSERPDPYLFFRQTLEGSLTLTGADYAWLYEQFQHFTCCVEVEVAVFSDAIPAGLLLHEAYFSIDAVNWIHHECKATVSKLSTRDAYDQLFRNWETEYNVLDPAGLGPLAAIGFSAEYDDTYTYQVNEQTGASERVLPDGNAAGTGAGKQVHRYDRAWGLMLVVDRLFQRTRAGLVVADRLGNDATSDFYEARINPVTRVKNRLVVIAGASDIKRPASKNVQAQLTLSLKALLDELRALHNVYWQLDEDGRLRLEHYSWFDQHGYGASVRPQLDLTTRYPDALAKHDTEENELDRLYEKEELVIPYNQSASRYWAFGQYGVTYQGPCINRDGTGKQKINTLSTSRVYTDLLAGYLNPDKIPDSAIFVNETETRPTAGGGNEQFLNQSPILGLGGAGASSTLFLDYHRYGRSYQTGLFGQRRDEAGNLVPGTELALLSTVRTRRLVGLVLPYCAGEAFNLLRPVKTRRFSRAQIERASFDLDKQTLTLDLAGESRCNPGPVTGPPDDRGCDPFGTYIRRSFGLNGCDVTTVYADGQCGEYALTFPTMHPGCS